MGDFGELGRDLERAAARLEEGGRRLLEEVRDAALEKAVDYSSAPPLTPEERKEAPFAVRHGAPLDDPAGIHLGAGATQGDFASAWKPEGPLDAGDGLVVRVTNDSPEGEFLAGGTPTMFARPVGERVEAEVKETLDRRVEQLLQSLFRG